LHAGADFSSKKSVFAKELAGKAKRRPRKAHNRLETRLVRWGRERLFMPNDAKLGLVLGIALVLLIGLVFFRKDPTASAASATATVNSPAALPSQTPPP
jgi:hypothetical protein